MQLAISRRRWVYGIDFAVAHPLNSRHLSGDAHTSAGRGAVGGRGMRGTVRQAELRNLLSSTQSVNYDNDKDVKTNARMGTDPCTQCLRLGTGRRAEQSKRRWGGVAS